MLVAARAMTAGLQLLEPLMMETGVEPLGTATVVVGGAGSAKAVIEEAAAVMDTAISVAAAMLAILFVFVIVNNPFINRI